MSKRHRKPTASTKKVTKIAVTGQDPTAPIKAAP